MIFVQPFRVGSEHIDSSYVSYPKRLASSSINRRARPTVPNAFETGPMAGSPFEAHSDRFRRQNETFVPEFVQKFGLAEPAPRA
jgi:hypothetical protein